MSPSDNVIELMAELFASGKLEFPCSPPILTRSKKCFPDPWTPDLEGVRRMLLRLADYAGIGDLPIDVYLTEDMAMEEIVPGKGAGGGRGVAAAYHGRHEGRAIFSVAQQMLGKPEELVAVLAHELAHAWRDVRGLLHDTQSVEEQLTDATTIGLGFGILTCNEAYRYESTGSLRGGRAQTTWQHSQLGYLSVEEMSALLSLWTVARRINPNVVRGELEVTQQAFYNRYLQEFQNTDLLRRIGVALDMQEHSSAITVARPLEFPAGAIASHIFAIGDAVSARLAAGERVLVEPMEFPYGLEYTRSYAVAEWGRVQGREAWWRTLHLAADHLGERLLMVACVPSPEEISSKLLGVVPYSDPFAFHTASSCLGAVVDRNAALRELLFPSLPTIVRMPDNRGWKGRDAQQLFMAAFRGATNESRARDLEFLDREEAVRLSALERGFKGLWARLIAGRRSPAQQWWSLVTDGMHSADHAKELGFIA